MRGDGTYRNRVAQPTSIASPVYGLNARDPIAAMDPRYAILLENWFPEANSVRIRKGSATFATGMGAVTQTIMSYTPRTGGTQLYAANNGSIYNVSASGAVGAAVVSGLSSNYWHWWQTTNSAGAAFLTIANGVDTVRQWDGAAWTAPAITGPAATSDLITITAHMHRLWFIQKASMLAWYLPVDAITGAALSFNFGPIFRKGGFLSQIGTWTLDAGIGMDDHLVAITSEGEVAVYKGTDPASADTWALVGVFELAPPIGRKCLCKFGGDLLVLTNRGIFPLSNSLKDVSTASQGVSLSSAIDPLLKSDFELYGTLTGWEMVLYAPGELLVVNVPESTTTAHQWAMNTLTKRWTKFTGWASLCYVNVDSRLFFGASTKTVQAWQGGRDDTTQVTAQAVQAFNYFGSRTAIKRWTLARLIFDSADTISMQAALSVDFNAVPPTDFVPVGATTSALWDTATWDTAVWGGGTSIYALFQSVSGMGYNAAISLKAVQVTEPTRWLATDYAYEVARGFI